MFLTHFLDLVTGSKIENKTPAGPQRNKSPSIAKGSNAFNVSGSPSNGQEKKANKPILHHLYPRCFVFSANNAFS